MEKSEIVKAIAHEIVKNHSNPGTLESSISASSDFRLDLGLDSLDIVELAYFAEDEYNVSIPDDALYHIDTIGELADLVLVFSK